MKKFYFYLFNVILSTSTLIALTPPPLQQTPTFQPINTLLSSTPPKEAVWIEGNVVAQEDGDVYLLADATGSIHIFLSVDELSQITLTPNEHIAVWGKVDKSPIGYSRNEFYVEKMYEMPKCEKKH